MQRVVYTVGKLDVESVSITELTNNIFRTVLKSDLEINSLKYLAIPIVGTSEFLSTTSYVLLKLLQREYGNVICKVIIEDRKLVPLQRIDSGPTYIFERDYGINDNREERMQYHPIKELTEYLYLPAKDIEYWENLLDAKLLKNLVPICPTQSDPRLLWALVDSAINLYDIPMSYDKEHRDFDHKLRALISEGACVIEYNSLITRERIEKIVQKFNLKKYDLAEDFEFAVLSSPFGEEWLRDALVNTEVLQPHIIQNDKELVATPEELAWQQFLFNETIESKALNSHTIFTERSEPIPIPEGRYLEKIDNLIIAVALKLVYEASSGVKYSCIDAANSWWIVGTQKPPQIDRENIIPRAIAILDGIGESVDEFRRLITKDGKINSDFLL